MDQISQTFIAEKRKTSSAASHADGDEEGPRSKRGEEEKTKSKSNHLTEKSDNAIVVGEVLQKLYSPA